MRALFRKLRGLRFRYEPLIAIFIHRDRILHNLREFQHLDPHVAVAPVLKSNAYGHGLVPVAKILADAPEAAGIPFLCVDSYMEALILRNEGIRLPLLVIGYTPLTNVLRSKLKNVSFAVTSMDELRRLAREGGRPVTVHLKIDTGMHRQGIMPEELDEALRLVAESGAGRGIWSRSRGGIMLAGAYSHLADADTEGSPLTAKQIARWNGAVRVIRDVTEKVRSKNLAVRYFHLSNTAGSRHAEKIDANVMRLGIGLYGIDPAAGNAADRGGVGADTTTHDAKKLNLLPALEMKTRITSVRTIASGESVGYNATFTAKETMTVATIPVGYAEGLDRRLSNVGAAMVAGIPCPFVGRINMNITSIDVSGVPAAKLDDEVQVISPDPAAPNSIAHMAKRCGTIPYELLIRLPAQIRRVVSL